MNPFLLIAIFAAIAACVSIGGIGWSDAAFLLVLAGMGVRSILLQRRRY